MWNGVTNAFRGMLNGIVGMWNRLHFTVPSILGSPSFTVSLPQIPSFESGGVMPYTGLAMLHRGETVTPAGRGGGDIHIHIDQGAYIDGPSIDVLTNAIARRMRLATGY